MHKLIMPKPRKKLISLEATPYYHCTSRCVRRAFLCGTDKHTKTSYEHRRSWIEQRILDLADIFSIDVCAYAIMHNHYHIILHINQVRIMQWSDKKVCEQWHRLYKGSALSRRFIHGSPLSMEEQDAVTEEIQGWRKRLIDISWFMRALNEPIARQANEEDQCTGKFWEARFSSQALLDEKALAACMVYVDLNPVRAKINSTPETSSYTSIRKRIYTQKQYKKQPSQLMKFIEKTRQEISNCLPFKLESYLDLINWTGEQLCKEKRCSIEHVLPPILEQLQIDKKTWHILSTQFEQQFSSFVGSAYTLKITTKILGYQRTPNIRRCQTLLQ